MAKAARASFGSILDTPSANVERPKPIPRGSYICSIQGLPRIDKTTGKGTDFVEFTLQLQEALDDVDEDALEEMGSIKGKTIRYTIYVTEKSKFRLADFLDHCDAGDEDMTLGERVQETPGKQVVAYIQPGRPNDRGETYSEVSRTAPVK